MRRIGFRIWDKNSRKFNYNPDLIFNSRCDINQQLEELNDRYGLEQYTGLKDCNDKEIYEGDIVKIPDDWEEFGMMSGANREIYFKLGGFRLKPTNSNSAQNGYWLDETSKHFEIIGNIHENPELLQNEA